MAAATLRTVVCSAVGGQRFRATSSSELRVAKRSDGVGSASSSLPGRQSPLSFCWGGGQPAVILKRRKVLGLRALSTGAEFGTREFGQPETLEYRIFFADKTGKTISPWHDIPLKAGDGVYNFIVEVPKESRAKFEVAIDELNTPIKQDTKNGKLRFYPYNINWNYGLLPQTWEDPSHANQEVEGAFGDNDPVDVVEIGERKAFIGEVLKVKPVAVLAMIDEGELDWKVVAISLDDPKAGLVNDIDDVEKLFPGTLTAIRDWFRDYKIPDGKPANKFGLGNRAADKNYALKVIEETNGAWTNLVKRSVSADVYERFEVEIRGPQTLRPAVRRLETKKIFPVISVAGRADERMSLPRRVSNTREDSVYPTSVGGRVSQRKIVSSRISINGPSRLQEDEKRGSTQSIEGAGDLNGGNYTGSQRVVDMSRSSEGIVYQKQEVDPQNGRVKSTSFKSFTSTEPEVIQSNVPVQQSTESEILQLAKYLDQAEALLEQGMHGLEGRIEVGVAERMLYEAADLLEKASEGYPANLTVVGQWGSTLLVHGQLKLKLSQQLRFTMLPSAKTNSALMMAEGSIVDGEQDSMELTLQEVCEECEELLVDAGRKFRKALTLDRRDVRALYNWGLALCYRGQLISEEGGERALQDADKVFLAAIDKFEAMLGISQDYAAGALLNWGQALRDRSRLRDMGDKERLQLLLQAKELFLDAVHLDPNYGEATGALAVCSAELKELQGFNALQRQETTGLPNRNWFQRGS